MSDTSYIFDVSGSAQFEQLVIENSFHKPVLVDFWAEWCAPCKALMPLLAQITEGYQGELLLAKVNCDLEQDLVARFGIRSLPTVVLFKNGQPVDGLSGAQPESAIRELLKPHVNEPAPAAADPLEAAQALFAEGRIADAEALLKQLLGADNENAPALILYARCLAERGELDEAQSVLDAVKGDDHKPALAGALAQLTFLRQAADLPDVASLKTRLAKNGEDDEAAYQLAIQQLARQQYEPALEALLQLFTRNRNYADGAAHKTLLQVFDLLGTQHPLVTTYRRKLYQAIY
ncbi:MAG: thioredoxin [Pseudomonas sp.]|nr:thioredoxin [Pseudomonas sp.]